MTEFQVLALQQLSIGLAAFHRDHLMIKTGGVILDQGDTYDIAKVETAIQGVDAQLRSLCVVGGRSDL